MIVSHRHRFIFIKTTKTAGTSVEIFLRQFCGPDDIVTSLRQEEEREATALGLTGPRNVGSRPLAPWEVRRADLRRAIGWRRWPDRCRFSVHQSASSVRDELGVDTWSDYRTLTVVRDPWEVAVSRFFWKSRPSKPQRRHQSLDEAVEMAGRNWEIFSIDDAVGVDTVLRYERLADDLAAFCDSLGLDATLPLPRAKSGHRPAGTAPHEVLSPAQARRVAELAHREIEEFGFAWRGPEPL